MIHYEMPRIKIKDIVYPMVSTGDNVLIIDFEDFICDKTSYSTKQFKALIDDLTVERGWVVY